MVLESRDLHFGVRDLVIFFDFEKRLEPKEGKGANMRPDKSGYQIPLSF